ncbi:1-deoxy-D-xylulose-5-phosphate synthase [Coriobacteriales bacterium OH1046]|nr:1-deoxy-D-xylulose-5-phosphate synthase [Coriobacteriales bacterium OH1046]
MAYDMLARITGPRDLDALSLSELDQLAAEMRAAIVKRVDALGGHLGSNLGVVEPTIALHRVFDSPHDRIIFDTSHQCYAHKMLTGRAYGFFDEDRMDEISGFTNPEESEHDWFRCGHTSTSISLACGFAKARDILGQKHNVVAFIGDGCLSGGEAFEGLDNAATFKTNLIIVLNDNEMSIAEDQGGIYRNFAELRASGGQALGNFFSTFGFDYRYVEDGNSISDLIEAFEQVKDIDHPIVVHIRTTKGKGVAWAERNKEEAHSVKPRDASPSGETYTAITRARMLEKMAADPAIVVINAGTPGGVGITADFRAAIGDRYVDVGICEQHAVTFSAGLARGGAKPVYFVASTFLQRAYDQIVQDLALNQSPATVLVFQAGFSSIDATHLGVFDLAYTGNVPGLTCLAPTTAEQFLAMLDWAIDVSDKPVVIRVPDKVVHGGEAVFSDDAIARFEVERAGADVALVALGPTLALAGLVSDELSANYGILPTIISATTYSALDRQLLFSLETGHRLVVTLENGILYGGFGEKIARVLGRTSLRVLCYGGTKEFVDRVSIKELNQRYHLEPQALAADIAAVL